MNTQHTAQREYLLALLAAATFIIFFQLYMVAPLIPTLSYYFNAPAEIVGLIIPAYLIPYGISTLFYGLLADKIGAKTIILTSLCFFVILTGLTTFSQSIEQLILWRLLTAVGASGVIPIAMAWIGQTYMYQERGRPIGWLFGAMAGGGAMGSSFGVILEPYIGWKMLFVGVAILSATIWILLYLAYQKIPSPQPSKHELTLAMVFNGYQHLLSQPRGKKAYTFVLLNAIFHSGVFTWLGLYFQKTYHLNGFEIGLAILGYGLPGFLLGPFIGKLADKKGRSKLLPFGIAVSAFSVFVLAIDIPLALAAIGVTILSLGYDLTQPLLAGIVTQVGKERPGQAMTLNVFMLFIGFGLGSYLFGVALKLSFSQALGMFASFQTVLALVAWRVFKNESQATKE